MARRRNNINFPRVNGKTVVFTGGVNEGISNLELRPGDLFRCFNYEEIDGAFHGYSSVQGYERFDGTASPSDVFSQFVEDSGNDDYTTVLLESEDSEDTSDKSSNLFTTTQSNVSFVDTRSKFGEGSWYFNSVLDSNISVDLSSDPIDYSTSDWHVDGWLQVDDTTLSTCIVCEVSGVFKLSIVNGELVVETSTNGGVSYNNSHTYTGVTLIPNRWYQFSVGFIYTTAPAFNINVGINGGPSEYVTYAAQTVTNQTNPFVVGDGFTSTGNLYVDSIRLSNRFQWKSNDDYEYSTEYAFSNFNYYVFNADDIDREATRATILPVPGQNEVRDVHIFNSDVLAVRDHTNGVDGALYISSGTGWTALTNTSFEVEFDTGSIEEDIRTGETFTAAPSGATGTLYNLTVETGNPSANNAVGWSSVFVTSGTLAVGDVLTLGSYPSESITATAVSNIKVGPGPNVDFVTARLPYFPPIAPNTKITYFIANDSGLFATDGTLMTHIKGPTLDTSVDATNIAFFGDRLWLSYPDGHLFYSGPGDPAQWSGEFGAGEIFLGDEITNLVTGPGGTLLVFMEDSIKLIKHNAINDLTIDFPFILDDFSRDTGAYSRSTVSLLGDIYYCDDRGPTSMKQTDAYGDYEIGDLQKKAHLTYQNNKTEFTGAYVHRSKSQYRVMFNDSDSSVSKGVYYTFSDKNVKGVTLVEYPTMLNCFSENEDSDGNVFIVSGGNDGYVYNMDKGVSFDGDYIVTKMKSAFYHYATPGLWKRFYRVLFEMTADNKMQFFVKPDFNYSSSKLTRALDQEVRTVGQGGLWGFIKWGSFIWGGSIVSNPMLYQPGYGYNMAIEIATKSKNHEAHTVHNMIVDYANGNRYM